MIGAPLGASDRNLILTGYIGPDMAPLGRQIAEAISQPFVNLEALIAERARLTIDEIRTYFGEIRLKSIEAEIVQETALRRRTVILVSGRTLAQADHFNRLQKTGPIIALTIALDAMLQTLHMNMGARYHDPRKRASAISQLKQEWAILKQKGLHKINTTYMTRDEIVQTCIHTWRDLAIERA